MEIDLGGLNILVTGGSSGIGEKIVRMLARCGATVALHYNAGAAAAEKIASEAGAGVRCFQSDLSEPIDAGRLFDDVIEAFGSLDVLVNNAGLGIPSPQEKPLPEWLDIWRRTLDVNLTSAGVLCYKAINHFKERSAGRIIHIASRAAFRGETEEYLAYAASKGGMVSLSRSIARSFGKYNIKSFVIAPGFVRTKMMDEFLADHEDIDVLGELSLKELTTPADVAPVVAFIASGMMDHATGCTIDINAGSYMR
jgi:NAD(P)-dependent dehydrogenase (short-subunit alcohol dehydrogenase family)